MRKSKYETHVLPFLQIIEGWCRKGVIDRDIAKNLGVAYSTFRSYRKDHPELDEAMKTGKEIADIEVENALFKSATGYDVLEETHEVKNNGEETRRTRVVHIPASVKAQQFWLKNRKPEDWNDKYEYQISEKLEDLIE